MKKYLVIGSTGLVGSCLIKELLKDPSVIHITALVRKKSHIKDLKLNEIEFDFKNNSQIKTLDPVDHVFCCLGTTMRVAGSKKAFRYVDFQLPLMFAQWAESTNAKSFSIVTSMGANPKSSFFYNQVKGQIEQKIKKLDIPTIHIFQPSLIMGPRKEFRIGELIGKGFMTVINPFLVGFLKKFRGIHAKKIAQGLISRLKNPKEGVFVFESDQI